MEHPVYLSRVQLNARNRQVRTDLSDCPALHRTLMRAFPEAETPGTKARASFGLLYRVEPEPVGQLLLQSQTEPDWSKLPPRYIATAQDGEEVAGTKRIDEAWQAIERGQVLRFRLQANPTKRVGAQDSPARGKRVELVGEEEQIAWLARKGSTSGFRLGELRVRSTVLNVRASALSKSTGRRPNERGGMSRLTFGSVLFDGLLEVTDSPSFLTALAMGVGPGKAYGFGLLSVGAVKQE